MMIYRKLESHTISRLCFGTATFAAGKLKPNANSERGMLSLSRAIDNGVNFIHSNPKLMTQWAIRKVLMEKSLHNRIYHAIKIETPLGEKKSTGCKGM